MLYLYRYNGCRGWMGDGNILQRSNEYNWDDVNGC